MHGANASGRPFTGDYAGILLYETLHAYGFASQPSRRSRATTDCARRTAGSPTRSNACRRRTSRRRTEVRTCNGYPGGRSCARVPAGGAILALGRIAHDADAARARLRAVGLRVRARRAASRWRAGRRCSTAIIAAATTPTPRRLTTAMFRAVFDAHRRVICGGRSDQRHDARFAPDRATTPAIAPMRDAAAVRRARAARVAAASAGRLPDARRRRRDALRRQGARPQEARRRATSRRPATSRASPRWWRRSRASRRRSRAPKARRCCSRTISSRRTSRATTSCFATTRAIRTSASTGDTFPQLRFHRGALDRKQPLLRPVPERRRGARRHRAAAEGVPAAHLREHGVRQPLAAVHAPPDPALHGAVRRAHRRRRTIARTSKARRCSCRARPSEVLDAAAGADGRGGGGARVRARGAHSRQDQPPAAAAVAPVRRERDGGRHRRRRRGVGARPGRRQRRDDPRRAPRRRPHVLSAARRCVDPRRGRDRAGVSRAALSSSGRCRRRSSCPTARDHAALAEVLSAQSGARSRSSAIPAASAACG